MYICDELMDKVSNSEIAEFLKANGIKIQMMRGILKTGKKCFTRLLRKGLLQKMSFRIFSIVG